MPGAGEGGGAELQEPAKRDVGIIREPLGIADGDEDEVKGHRRGPTAGDMAVADKAVIDPTKMRGDVTAATGTKQAFAHEATSIGERVERMAKMTTESLCRYRSTPGGRGR